MLIDAGDARDAVYIVMRGLLISERGDPAAAGGAGPLERRVGHHRTGRARPVGGVRGAQHAQHAQQGEPRVRGGGAEATMHLGAAINVTTWGTATPSHETTIAAQEALLLVIPGGILRKVAAAHPEIDDALWLAVGTDVTKRSIREHALAEGTYMAPWQLAQVMGLMRMHHVGQYHAQTLVFHPRSMVVLIAGSASSSSRCCCASSRRPRRTPRRRTPRRAATKRRTARRA